MRLYRRLLAVAILLLPGLASQTHAETWQDGGNYDVSWFNGSDNTYTLTTNRELAGMAYLIANGYSTFRGKTIKLGKDIDLSGKTWITAGTLRNQCFMGVFDGQGFKISGISISMEKNDQYLYGFWGYMEDATVKNVTFEGKVDVVNSNSVRHDGDFQVGGVAGAIRNTSFEKCRCLMDVIS